MTESEQSLNESLSAAIDGEADELELRRVLNAANEDADLRAKWRRMHLIGSLVRRETPSLITAPLPAWPATVDANPDHDDADDTDLGPMGSRERARRRMGGRWLAPLGSAALAAAAALVVVLYFGPREQDASLPAVAERPQAPVPGLANVPTELDIQRANAYIYRHARQTSIARPAAMPFAKVLATANDDAGDRMPTAEVTQPQTDGRSD